MAGKNFAEIDTGFPIYGLRFINNHTLLACGGGGEGNNGIPNKVTAVRCSFTVSDKNRRLQKFREITLPSNEDSPMCVEFCRSSADDNSRYSIFVGCNQSTELIRSMNINNNLRKYSYTDDEHLRFSDAVQFDDNLSVESIGEYPKIVHLSSDSSIGGMMTSRIPSEIFIFNPDSLELTLRFKPTAPSEIKDFHLSPSDSGKTLTYVTASFVETISTHSGNSISSSSNVDKKTAKTLGKYFFSKVRYIDESKVIITAALRNGRGAAVLEYNTTTRKVTKERIISNKIKGIVAIDVSNSAGVFAVAGNDFSVSLLKLSDFKVFKTYPKLHKFAVTCLSFSPDGKKLATGSASNTLNVLLVKPSSGGFFSFIYSLFRFIFFAILVAIFAAFVQQAHENGDLDKYLELSKIYGAKALVHAQHYQEVGLELSQKYGKEYFELSQHYGKIGLKIAREQTIKGVELIKEKVNKHMASNGEEPTNAESEFTESTPLPEWVSETTDTLSSIHSDIVEQHTKDVHELTKAPGPKDTLSIINEATQISILSSTAQIEEPAVSSDLSLEEPPKTHATLNVDESIAIESHTSGINESKELPHSTTTSISQASAIEVENAQTEQASSDYYENETLTEPSSDEKGTPENEGIASSNLETLNNETVTSESTKLAAVTSEEVKEEETSEEKESSDHATSILSQSTEPETTEIPVPETEAVSDVEEPVEIVPEAASFVEEPVQIASETEKAPSAASESTSYETVESVQEAVDQNYEISEKKNIEEPASLERDSVPGDDIPKTEAPVSSNVIPVAEESIETVYNGEDDANAEIDVSKFENIEPSESFIEPEPSKFSEPETLSSDISGSIESDILASQDVQPNEPIEAKEEVVAHIETNDLPQESAPQSISESTYTQPASEIIEGTPISSGETFVENAAQPSDASLEETLSSESISTASYVEEFPTVSSAAIESPDITSPENHASPHEPEFEPIGGLQTSLPEGNHHAEHDEL
ncbi:hypothetical protein JCM33374_g3016 [Metschnikowia sp. JCM 33374]|nr:hypothetical protein JCM33374_g3016 [Metschnikowia sp. JCM 33374]